MVFIKILPTITWFCCCLTNLKKAGIIGSILTAVLCCAGLYSCFAPLCETIYDSDQKRLYVFLQSFRVLFIIVQIVLLISSIALTVIFLLDLRRFIFVGEVVVFCGFLAYPLIVIIFLLFYCLQLMRSMVDCGNGLDVIIFIVYTPMVFHYTLPVNSYCSIIKQEELLRHTRSEDTFHL